MSLPKEPRQKMINIMYLVLTALLALNVSSEILNAFKTVRRSLENTNKTVNESTETILSSLKQKQDEPATHDRAVYWYPKAQQAQSYSETLYKYIEDLKGQIIDAAGGDRNNPSKSFNEDNLDIVTRIMINKKEGDKLKAMLEKYTLDIKGIDTALARDFKDVKDFIDVANPPGQDGKKKAWDVAYFHMVPTVAGLTILSKFQNDLRTAENKVVAKCHEKVGEVKVIFNQYAPIVGQSSNYLLPGQNIDIRAGVGAFNTESRPIITIGGSGYPLTDSGFARASLPGGALGTHTIPVHISYTNQATGQQSVLDYNVTYTVGQSNASIALDKMNVLYIGVDNPITIAASGGGDEKVQASINNGTLTKLGGGKYVAHPASITDDCNVTVMIDGKMAGQSKFRVRTIPGAQAYVGGQPSGANMAAGAFKAQGGVGAGIKDFPFELSYDVVSFTFTCDTDDGDLVSVPSNGAAFTGAVRTAINNNVKAGHMVTIDNIRVKGPDGRTTSAPSLIYYIK